MKIAELADEGKIAGIADLRDDSSGRTGQRLVIVLKRDAERGWCSTTSTSTRSCRTLRREHARARRRRAAHPEPRRFITYWVDHQIEVILRRTAFRLARPRRAHILRGYLKALDALDDVIALIRRVADGRGGARGLMALLDIDEIQATAILDMQLRRLAALERQKIIDEHDELERMIADFQDILATRPRQRPIVADELARSSTSHGDERRTRFMPADGDLGSEEDLIPVRRGGRDHHRAAATPSAPSRRLPLPAPRWQGGAWGDPAAPTTSSSHFFVTTTHHWILFFTNQGRVYRTKAYDAARGRRATPRASTWRTCWRSSPTRRSPRCWTLRDYEHAPYLVLATKHGLVKKTALTEYDTNRTGGLIAINLQRR